MPGGMRAPPSACLPCRSTPRSRLRGCSGSPDGPPLMAKQEQLTLSLHKAIGEVSAVDWDACAGAGNPFVSHAFLACVEESGSANARTGWLPQHAVLRDGAGRVMACAPMYAKSHSYGEYVFD